MAQRKSNGKFKYIVGFVLIVVVLLLIIGRSSLYQVGTPSAAATPTNTATPPSGAAASTSAANTGTASATSPATTPSQTSESASDNSNLSYNTGPEVKIDSTVIDVAVSQTNAQVQQGLSGRPSLGADDGMLFLFAQPAILRFWMPDMNFNLDMIWINNGQVVDISRNVPDTFNPQAPIFYTPKAPAQYVIEVNAGFSAQHNINPGDPVTFIDIPPPPTS